MEDLISLADYEFLGNPLWRWALYATVTVVGAGLTLLARRLVLRRLKLVTERTATFLDDALVEAVQSIPRTVVFILVAIVAAGVLDLSSARAQTLETAGTVVFIVLAGGLLQRMLRAGVRGWRQAEDAAKGERATMATAIGFVGRLVIAVLVLTLVLTNLGVEIGPLLAGLGVGGVAAALAAQNVLGDLFAAFSIYIDRPFDIGEFVILGDEMGTVKNVGWRSSRIAALGGQQLVIPNADIAQSRVHNYGRMLERRIVTEVGIEYGTDTDRVPVASQLLKEAAEDVDGIRFDRAHFKGFGPSSLDFELVWYVLSPDYAVYMDRQQELLLGVLSRFRAAGLSFAFPTRTLHVASLPPSMPERAIKADAS
ncbi:MAG: mechanosensitive ion channel family protein [Sandaracinaceae bacterium]